MKSIMLGIVCIIFLSPILGHALTIVAGGVQVVADYTEPNINADGTPLTDLAKTSIYFSTSTIKFKKDANNLIVASDSLLFDAPATSPIGGGDISKSGVVPWPSGKSGNVNFYAVAFDTNSLVSDQSNIVIVKLDTLSPGAPKMLTISGNMLFYNYREPMLNTDSTVLDDLAFTKIYYNDSVSAALRLIGTFPASSSLGGESQLVSFPLETFIKGSIVKIYARFVDINNNISPLPQALGIKIPN